MHELAHSLNIKLDPEIAGRISELQQRLREHFKERRTVDPSPHLSLLLRFAPREHTAEINARLLAEFSTDRVFSLTFAGYSASESGEYIFLDFDTQSTELLHELNQRAARAVGDIGTGGQEGAPARYPYRPHISLIKLMPEESALALGLLRNELLGTALAVSGYTVTVDDELRPGNIRTLQEITLH